MTRVKASAIINIKTIEGSTYMNKKEEYQEIYINLDDSGKLTKKEKVSVNAGIVFLSKQEKGRFLPISMLFYEIWVNNRLFLQLFTKTSHLTQLRSVPGSNKHYALLHT